MYTDLHYLTSNHDVMKITHLCADLPEEKQPPESSERLYGTKYKDSSVYSVI